VNGILCGGKSDKKQQKINYNKLKKFIEDVYATYLGLFVPFAEASGMYIADSFSAIPLKMLILLMLTKEICVEFLPLF
jgi:hypothetical protein